MGSFSQLNMANEESAAELFQAQAQILSQILNFINSGCLKCATQLGIYETIHSHGKPMTLSQLIAALPIHQTKSPFVYRLMRVLVNCGFFHVQNPGESGGEEAYSLTSTCKLLLKNNPLSVAPFLPFILHPTVIQPWQCLSTWFQNDDPTPFETAYGKPFWECVGHDSELNNSFNGAMQSDSQLITTVLIEKCKGVFEGLESLVDVGGGTGAVAKAIADAFPDMECTVFDLPHVVGDLEPSKNMKYVGGNMFEKIPSADAVLLKCTLHDWSDEESVKILQLCKEAVTSNGKEGKVIIIEMIIENGHNKSNEVSTQTQLFSDMLMMTLLTGKERSEREWAKIFSDAGFRSYQISHILGLRSLIEVYP